MESVPKCFHFSSSSSRYCFLFS
ncbi:hypothetical protein Gohar_025692 [Gossypium harknessii]|uniref:Uncharacterized protein n=1 Tax=Gossypium harknessii TaxID=34285 RepID=A0A7J9I938_9ROSI|nr:hypothetical protein [Gossypium harknessii]